MTSLNNICDFTFITTENEIVEDLLNVIFKLKKSKCYGGGKFILHPEQNSST